MNLFTGRNLNNDECIFDVHSFARELDEDTLRTKVNGGCCDASAPSAPPSPPSGNNTPKAPAITGTTPTTNTPNPSDPSNPGSGYTGGGYEPPPEVMSNPQAYGYWKALQALAEQQGDPDRYKDYNVLPDYKQNGINKSKKEHKSTMYFVRQPQSSSEFIQECQESQRNALQSSLSMGSWMNYSDPDSVSSWDNSNNRGSITRQTAYNENDFHCDIYAWNEAVDRGMDPRGQNGEAPDLNQITVNEFINYFPYNRNTTPPSNTEGYVFYDFNNDGNYTHIEYYSAGAGTDYTIMQTRGILPPVAREYNSNIDSNGSASVGGSSIYVPLDRRY